MPANNQKRFFLIFYSISSRIVFNLVLSISLIFTLTQCQKDTNPDNTTVLNSKVKMLGHKGGGNNSYNDLHIENTLPSVQDGLKTLNGVELDVQMSLDGTIWLFHHVDIAESACNSNYHHSIPLLTDNQIQGVQICSGTKQSRIYKLKEIIDYWNSDTKGFYISMHVKLDFPSDTLNNSKIGGEAVYLSKLADSLATIS